ncbi:hypothetical protein [Undibacterium terreum]|uniref:Uncharacterized protein n=1 Tax=Undibacterium terreum TaxID=1224302 RepID=A0A916XS84_9BURK|nr:hypothetical protein [Undibacterium terreum]GGC96836.1 hypothetical protein GCM10011396_50360 [Undibacterium terreum]
MQFSPEHARSRRPVIYLALVALFHTVALYALLGQGMLTRKTSIDGAVVYMDIRSIKAPPPPPMPSTLSPDKSTQPAVLAKRTKQSAPQSQPIMAVPRMEVLPAAEPERPTAHVEEKRLDLDSLRAQARKNDSKREMTLAEQIQAKEQRDVSIEAKIAAAAEGAARKDCLTAHSDTGLLAPLFVLKDTVTGKGCKW